jgi:hypothetical protein
MFALSIARSLEKFGRRSAPQFIRTARPVALLFSALFAAGCTSPPAPVAGADPSDPSAARPPVAYRAVTHPYASQRPADPAPWGEQNERVTPQEKP